MHLYISWSSSTSKVRFICSEEWFYQQCCSRSLGRTRTLYSDIANVNIEISKAHPKFQHVFALRTQKDLSNQETKPTYFQALAMYLCKFFRTVLKHSSLQGGRLAQQPPEQERLTYHTFGKRGSFQGCQTQVSNLDWSSGASDEDVVTFQVSVNDGRSACVQKL